MIGQKTTLARFSVQILSICTTGNGVVIPKESTGTEFWDEQFNYIFEGTRIEGVSLLQDLEISEISLDSKVSR